MRFFFFFLVVVVVVVSFGGGERMDVDDLYGWTDDECENFWVEQFGVGAFQDKNGGEM